MEETVAHKFGGSLSLAHSHLALCKQFAAFHVTTFPNITTSARQEEEQRMMKMMAMAMTTVLADAPVKKRRKKIQRRNAKLQLTCMTIKIKLYTPKQRDELWV